jgi:hypothetical protein
MDRYSRQLVALIDDQVDRMSKAVEVAVDDKALNRAKSLLTRIVALNPKVKGIAALKRKVNALEQSKTVAS